MQKPDSARCENCLFFSNRQCKRYPPQYVNRYSSTNITNYGGTSSGTESHSPNAEFPYVSESDFCGEFLPSQNLDAMEWVAWKKGLLEDGKSPS